jgi:hypothetical protein
MNNTLLLLLLLLFTLTNSLLNVNWWCMRRAIHDTVSCACGRSGVLGTLFGNNRSSGLSWHWLYHTDSGFLRLLYIYIHIHVCVILLGPLCVFNNAVLRCTVCTDRAADRSVAGCAAGVPRNLCVSTDGVRGPTLWKEQQPTKFASLRSVFQ